MNGGASALYVGRVTHRRTAPRVHTLAYRVFWLLLDLDEIDGLAGRLRLFSRNRFNLYSFRDSDYGDRSGAALRPQVEKLLGDAGLDCGGGPIRLLTMPRILGYGFNPLSAFFCHRPDGRLGAIVYEVHNTFGELHHYVAPVEPEQAAVSQRAPKRFHVSPFMGLEMRYDFNVVPPGEKVAIAIEGSGEHGHLITAALAGKRREIGDGELLKLLATHPLLTLKVTFAIHWHALRLLLKRIPFHGHPGPAVENVTRAEPVRDRSRHA